MNGRRAPPSQFETTVTAAPSVIAIMLHPRPLADGHAKSPPFQTAAPDQRVMTKEADLFGLTALDVLQCSLLRPLPTEPRLVWVPHETAQVGQARLAWERATPSAQQFLMGEGRGWRRRNTGTPHPSLILEALREPSPARGEGAYASAECSEAGGPGLKRQAGLHPLCRREATGPG
jgi:hypothetical protein